MIFRKQEFQTRILYSMIFMLCVVSSGAQDNLQLFKTLPPIDASTPSWAQMMYSARPNVWKVDSMYEAYYRQLPFVKSTHTQNYKHWRRLIDQNNWIDTEGYLSIPSMEEQQGIEARWLKQRQGTTQTRSVMSGNWQSVGPHETWDGTQWISKQVNVYTIDQSLSDPEIVFCGTETGGVYKSVDTGMVWTSIGDDLILGGIGSIKVHPYNPDTVYLGQGNNLYRSVDGGNTWATAYSYSNLNVRDILFVPASGMNHMIILAACQQGLIRSIDGGATWSFIVTDQCWDLELRPGSLDTVYLLRTNTAALHIRFYRSTDKGLTFTEFNSGWYAGSLTLDNSNKGARMAVTSADPDYVYVALLGNDVSYDQDNNWIGVYKSTDGGTSWTLPAGDPGGPYSESHYCPSSFHPWFEWGGHYDQGYYDLAIAVSATDPEDIMLGCLNLWHSENGSATYTGIGGYFGGISGYSHPDIQEIEINGDDVWVVTDGGVDLYAPDLLSKVSLNNGINGSDYWGFDIGWNAEIMGGGRYHNGNAGLHENYPSGSSISLGGGEAASGYVNQGFPRKVYHSDVGGKYLPDSINLSVVNIANLGKYPNESYYNESKGELEVDPRCFNHLFLTSAQGLWKSENAGIDFTLMHNFGTDVSHKATGFEISRSDTNVIYVCQRVTGASKLWKTADGGVIWNELPLPTTQTGGGIFISLNPENADELYLAVSNGGSNTNKIFKTTNGGTAWTNLTTSTLDGHWPEQILMAGGTDGGVYVATNFTVFYRNNQLSDWQLMDTGLPAKVSTMTIKPFYRKGEVRIATNRGIWSSPFYEDFDPVIQPTVDKLISNCSRDTFYFEDYSMVKHDGAAWSWSFSPDPEWVSALNVRNPKVVFGADGSYDVSLSVDINGDTLTKSVPHMVTVENACEPDTVAGQALRTLADGDYFISPDANLNNITHFTVTGWWKPNGSQSGFGAIFSSGDWCAHCDYTEGLIVDYFGTRLWYKWPGNASNWGSNSGMVIPLDEWSYVALVIEPTGATLYLNEQKYVHNIPLDPGNIQSFYVGYGHYSHSFVGDIDEVTIWKRALSEEEIRRLRHLTKEDVISGDPDLVAYYQFNTLVDDQVLDHASIHHGSLNAGASLEVSHAPIGGGSSDLETVLGAGEVAFQGAGVTMVFPQTGTYPNGDLVVSRLNVAPDTLAYDPPLMDSTYWIVNNYGSNQTFSELSSITFSGLSNVDSLIPEVYSLYKRGSNEMGNTWGNTLDAADSAATSTLVFSTGNSLTGFSQFTIGSNAACVTVVNTNDGGVGSLREALVCVLPGGSIVFDPVIDGDTIHLVSKVLYIQKDVSIFGRGVTNTVISGAALSRVIDVDGSFLAELQGLSLIGGTADTGRVIYNTGDLILRDVVLHDHLSLNNNNNSLIQNVPGASILVQENVQVRQ